MFALVILVTLAAPAFSDDVTLTASAGTGVMYGLARELVYSTSTFNGKSYTLSELDWDIKPLYYTRAALAIQHNTGIRCFTCGSNGHSGQNRDQHGLGLAQLRQVR